MTSLPRAQPQPQLMRARGGGSSSRGHLQLCAHPMGAPLRALLCLIVLATVRPSLAAEIESVTFADQSQVHNVTLHLNCTGLLRYLTFIKGYVAALYLGDGVRPDDVLSDVSKRLEIDYFYSIKAHGFANATDQGMAANADPDNIARLRSRIDQLNAWYEDVKPGDRYSLTYLPGIGTELALNGQSKGTIPGADFAAALFGIWLGPKPLDVSLKSQLLHCR
jgi:hypothetical protein